MFHQLSCEHCSANAEAMGSNSVEAPKTFFGLNCDDHTIISLVVLKVGASVMNLTPKLKLKIQTKMVTLYNRSLGVG